MGAIEEYKARRAAQEARQAKQQEPPKKRTWWFSEAIPIDRFTGWLMAYTGLLFLATIINAVVLYKTDITLHDTLVATQRPWVSVSVETASELHINADTIFLSINIKLKNVGKSPARIIRGATDILNGNVAVNFIDEQKRICDGGVALPQTGMGQIIFPDEIDSLRVPLYLQRRDVDLAHALKQERDKVPSNLRGAPSFVEPTIVGCISYQFTFGDGEIHKTGFSYNLRAMAQPGVPIASPIWLDRSVVAREELMVEPSGVGGYAN